MPPIVPIDKLKQEITLLADQCVKCGLCSTRCPTYQINNDENESPRGRIALAQAVAADGLKSLDRVQYHLDNCLYCQQCETACPSAVQYTRIIDNALQVINESKPKTYRQKIEQLGIKFVSQQKEKDWQKLKRLWNFLSPIAVRPFVSKLGVNSTAFKRSSNSKQWIDNRPNTDKQKTIYFFTGCISHLFDTKTLADTKSLLNFLGYQVEIPEQQTCCGAIAKHRGYTGVANKCEALNESIFSQTDTPIIYSTTGCGAVLRQYAGQVSQRFVDINQFLVSEIDFDTLDFAPLAKKVFIHSPCSQQKSIAGNKTIESLLSKIPQLEILPATFYQSCCGAGGSHFVRNPAAATKIRQPLIDLIQQQQTDYIVSSNFTCAMHIFNGVVEKKMDIPVIHPISLLWQQLKKTKRG